MFTVEAGGSSRDLPLRAEVTVESTTELPHCYTADSIFMDIMADPKAAPVMREYMKEAAGMFGNGGGQDSGSDAAKEAISDEMNLAMMNYMPLRGAASLGGGSAEDVEKLVKKLNNIS